MQTLLPQKIKWFKQPWGECKWKNKNVLMHLTINNKENPWMYTESQCSVSTEKKQTKNVFKLGPQNECISVYIQIRPAKWTPQCSHHSNTDTWLFRPSHSMHQDKEAPHWVIKQLVAFIFSFFSPLQKHEQVHHQWSFDENTLNARHF